MSTRDTDEFADAPPHIREHAERVREVQRQSREADAIRATIEALPLSRETTREPFADGWDPGAPTPAREDPETRNLRLRIVSQLGEPPTVSAELATDLHGELARIESFCARVRSLLGLPPR